MNKEELIKLIKDKYNNCLFLIAYYNDELETYPLMRTSGYSTDELNYAIKKYKIISKVYYELLLESGADIREFNHLREILERKLKK